MLYLGQYKFEYVDTPTPKQLNDQDDYRFMRFTR